MKRCSWVKETNPIYVAYHDNEWGRQTHDEQALFECLCLESYQAGLSWETVLNKREAFQRVFYHYQVDKVAGMTDEALDRLMTNPELIRHKAKLYATRTNARAFIQVQEEFGSFNDYIWRFVDGRAIVNRVERYQDVPARTAISEALAKDLKKRGFKFIGPVSAYAYMQSIGMVNDHEEACDFKYH